MSKPQRADGFYHVENFEAVYAHVKETWQNPKYAQRYHALLSTLLKPQVHFGEGVEDQMTQEVNDGALCAIAFTHGSALDPVHIAAMASQNESFEPLIGKTMIGAKASLFSAPIIGRMVPDLGAVPIWRYKDVHKGEETPEETERLEEFRRRAGAAFVENQIVGMNSGHHLAMHVEGSRHKGKPTDVVQEVKPGFGKIVSTVDPSINVLVMTAAFYYGNNGNKTSRRPTMYVDIPHDQRRDDPEEVTDTISRSLQYNLHQAIARHK